MRKGMWLSWGRSEICTNFLSEILKAGNNLEYPGIYGRIIWKMDLRE
jgi:hypothetical protein